MKATTYHSLALASLCGAMQLAEPAIALEQQWRYSYDSNGQLLEVDGPRSTVADLLTHRYDTSGNRISSTNALGHRTLFADHNQRGQPGRIVDANGVVTTLTYHPRGWLASATVHSPDGDVAADATTRYSYDGEGLLVSLEAPDGSVLNYQYDTARRLIAVRNTLGEELRYSLDTAGNRVVESSHTASGSLAREATRQFDELNRLLMLTIPNATSEAYGYDRNGNRVSTTDGNGNLRLQTYDALARNTTLQGAGDFVVQLRHDGRDNLVEISDPAGLLTQYQYDGQDNLLALDSPDTALDSYSYDSAGNRVSVHSARGVTASTEYDALNRPVAVRFPNSALDIQYHYDAGSNGLGRLTGFSDASGTTAITYDHRGNVVRRSWNTGSQVLNLAFDYDLADRLTRITYPSGRRVDYGYDGVGQITRVTTTGADGVERLLAEGIAYRPFGPVANLVLGNSIAVAASYDMDYRLVSQTHGSVLNRDYRYDAAGNLVDISDHLDSSRSQSMAYDALNRLGTASGPYGALSYSYDATGNRLAVTRGSVADAYSYGTGSHRLLATADWTFNYDTGGNVTARVDRGDADDNGVFYHYDDHNRLQRVTRRDTVGGEQQETVLASYLYNAAGQRATRQRNDSQVHFVYDSQGQLLAEINGEGLTLREYVYLGRKPLAMAYTRVEQPPAEPGTEIIIDDAGPGTTQSGDWERVRKKGAWGDYYHRSRDNGASFRWSPDNLNPARYEVYAWWPKSRKNNPSARFTIRHNGNTSIATTSQASNGKRWVKLGTYAFAGSGDEYVELADQGGLTAADGIRLVELVEPPPTVTAGIYYFHNDHLGTPQVVTDQSGNVAWQADYRPFGKADVVTASIEQNLRFPGQYFDSETGLHYNYFRDYDPALGRYLQSDPIGLEGGISTYAYAQGNPLTLSDPSGLLTVAEANTIGGTIGGAIGGGINGALSGAGIGSAAGTVIPGIGNLAGGFVGASLGAARGAAGGALAGAASAELGLGGASLVAAVTNGPMAGTASITSEVVKSLLPAPASQLGGGFLGGAIGGVSGGPLAVIGGAYGGVIGGAIAAAICLGDRECREELMGDKTLCE